MLCIICQIDITKYIAIELGCGATYDSGTGRTSIGVRKTATQLQEIIWSFTDRYMKCRQCGDPELTIDVHDGKLVRQCNACGYTAGDVAHRTTTYIIAHPPRQAANSLKMRGAAGATATRIDEDGIATPFDALAAYSSSLTNALPSTSSSSSSSSSASTTSSSSRSATKAVVAASDDEKWSDDDKPRKPRRKKRK
jgi:hypothetical protein